MDWIFSGLGFKFRPADEMEFVPLLDALGQFSYRPSMTTKHRFRNKFRLEIRERDHGPAHCHLVGGNTDVIIDLATLDADGEWPRGLRDEVLVWMATHHDELWEEWKKWHA